MRHVVQHPGDQALADDQHDGDEGRDLADGQRGGCGNAGRIRGCLRPRRRAHRQRPAQHQRQHHHHVFDDEPADGDAAAPGLDQAPLLERAQQNHGAGHRQRQAEHEAGAERPAEPMAKRHAEQRGAGDLCDGAGTAIARTESSCSSEKCRPTPNISKMTPISASSLASVWSATKPASPGRSARRPGDSRRAAAYAADGRASRSTQARASAMTMVEIRGWAIGQGRLKRSSPLRQEPLARGLSPLPPATSLAPSPPCAHPRSWPARSRTRP